jgi:hypothetical protein
MSKRPFLGAITFLAAAPFLLFLIYYSSRYEPPFMHWLVLEKFAVAASGVVGGVLLWRGSVWGYRLGLVAWTLATVSSASSLLAWYQVSRQPHVSELLTAIWLSKDAAYILIAAPTTYILIRDLFERKRNEKTS